MPITLTPDELATAQPVAAAPVTLTPEELASAQPAGGVSILRDFTPDQIVELSKQDKTFDLADAFRQDPSAAKDPALLAKASEAYHKLRMQPWYESIPVVSGIAHGDLGETIEGAKTALGNVGGMLKGGAKYVGKIGEVAAGEVAGGIASTLGLADEQTRRENQLETQRAAAEAIAGTESAAAGLMHQAGQIFGSASRVAQLAKPLSEYTPEEQQAEFQAAVFRSQLRDEASRGHGPLLSLVGDKVVKDLEAAQKPVRPEEVGELASGDPLTFMLFGKAIGGATKAGKFIGKDLATQTGLAQAAAPLISKLPTAERAAEYAGGKTLAGVGHTVSGGAKGTAFAAPVVGAGAGMTVAAKIPYIGELGIPGVAHLAGAFEGWRAGKAIAASLRRFAEKVKPVTEAGQKIASGADASGAYEQLGKDLFGAVPKVVGPIAHGAAFDVALASTMDTPAEKQSIGIGATLGLLGGAARGARHVISGQLIAPREFVGTQAPTAGSGAFPAFEALNRNSFDSLTPGQKVRLNATKSFLRGANPKADFFVGADSAAIEKALTEAGVSPENAATWSQQKAMTFDLNGRKVVIVSKDGLSSAPHEARHGIEDVLGEDNLRELDAEILSKYPVDAIGRNYTSRAVGEDAGPDWHGALLDVTGKGNVTAVEKLIEAATVKYHDEAAAAGRQPPSDAEIRNLVANDWAKQGQDWRTVLTPAEAATEANRYIAREIAAEHFDAWFKHTGGTGKEGTQVPQVLARWIGNVQTAFGGEPLAGRTSEGLKIPLTRDLAKTVGEQSEKLRPVVTPATAGGQVAPAGPATAPRTPEEQAQAAQSAADIAKTAPETPMPGATQSPREILGTAAEAIAGRTGIKLNYLSAPEEPAAAISSRRGTRRDMIEIYRRMPEDARKLWEKTFFPETVNRTKDGKYQIGGWAPEVFAANAQKLAEVIANIPELAALSPYELDAAGKSFTRTGWLDLYGDVETFVRNQQAGFTGSGQPLVVPPEMVGKGFSKPPERSAQKLALDQNKADFINMLFNFRLPDTTRLGHGKFPLNVMGQEVSKATMPGRLVEPLTPRGEFTGERAAEMGIEGRTILEVNPLRNRFENAAKNAGVQMPSFLEAYQKLNLERVLQAEHAAEAPAFRGNTLTLSAGFMPADSAGAVSAKEVKQAKTLWESKGTDSPYFRKWFGDSKIVDENGDPLVVYHGTTHKFDAFSEAKAFAENAVGRGHYFSTSPGDSRKNYAGVGQDLTARIDQRTDQILDEYYSEPGELVAAASATPLRPEQQQTLFDTAEMIPNRVLRDAAEKLARRELVGSVKDGRIIEAYVKLENPLVLSRKGNEGTQFEINYDEDTGVESGNGLEFHDAFFKKAKELGFDPQTIWELITQEGPEFSAETAYQAIIGDPSVLDAVNYVSSSAEIFRQIVESLGYDGIIMEDVATRFRGMGIPQGTKHVIAFKGDQVKSTENRGTFSPADRRLAFMPKDIEVEGPDGKKYKARHDGYQDFTAIGGGRVAQITALEDLPGGPVAKSTTYAPSLEKKGFKLPDLGLTEEGPAPTLPNPEIAQFSPRGREETAARKIREDEELAAIVKETFGFQRMLDRGETEYDGRDLDSVMDNQILRMREAGMSLDEVNHVLNNLHTPWEDFKGRVSEASFMPGKARKQNEYKLTEGPGMFSKVWILPDGKPVQLGGQWHHEWVNENPDVMKKFGLAKTTSGEENRVQALKKGFARVNYEKNTGTLKVEARLADWPKLAQSVKKLVETNLGKIDNMDVHLLDDKAKRIVEQDGVALHTYDKGEKMDHLPLISEPSSTTVTSPQGSAAGLRATDVQYMPAPGNAVRAAAVKDPETGKIWTGLAHGMARETAMEDGIPYERQLKFVDGFVTNDGEFLDREQAFKRAVELKQYHPGSAKTGDFDRSKILESQAFERQQRLQEMGYDPSVFNPPYRKMQAMPAELPAKALDAELEKVRTAKEFAGQTFTNEGEVWTPNPKKPEDIVTLASVNVPRKDLNRETVLKAIEPYADLLDEPNIVMGVFGFTDKEGNALPTVSIDINAKVPQKFRDNSVAFAKDNDQVSIWDPIKSEEVKTGGSGETKLSLLGELFDALDSLTEGKPVDVQDIIRENRDVGASEEQMLLGGTGESRDVLSASRQSAMTKAQLAAHFPEAVIPKRRNDKIDSDIVNSPLAKEAGSEARAVAAFAKRLVQFANEFKGHPVFESGLKWYSDFVPMLKKEFGKNAQTMAELLAATSPRNNPTINYAYSLDALEMHKAGRYDQKISKFQDGWKMMEDGTWQDWYAKELKAGRTTDNPTPAAFLAHWIHKHNLSPRQSNGAKFGMNSVAVLKTLAGVWLKSVEGPKVSNFVQNLLGTGHGATIDVWANRTMRRIGYDSKERWRILPKNESGVSDADFAFSQKAFAEAAKQLGVLPDALQGALWFAEKQLWADRGYARLDLGSFVTELGKTKLLKQGIQQRLAKTKQAAKAKTAIQEDLLITPRVEK